MKEYIKGYYEGIIVQLTSLKTIIEINNEITVEDIELYIDNQIRAFKESEKIIHERGTVFNPNHHSNDRSDM